MSTLSFAGYGRYRAAGHLSRIATFGKVVLPAVFALLLLPRAGFALGQASYVTQTPSPGSFNMVQAKRAANVYVDANDHAGVLRAANDLRADIARVTDVTPALANDENGLGTSAVIVGTIGKSRILDRLIREKKIDAGQIAGKWESFLIQVVPNPVPGVTNALVIAGSDKRGTIYGIYDVSEQIGVSPWYWWADVPVQHKDALFVKAGKYVQGSPAVKYRGIFINDEDPAMGSWAREKFGGFNSKMYVHMFELLLRLKANYLWPAMWGRQFYENDPESPRLANEYGIVIGTSHHEPMMRAQRDWSKQGGGEWDYLKNSEALRKFWAEGIRRNKDYETITTIGMRGNGDQPMMEDAHAAARLMETIVADQRKIIAEQVNPNVEKVPQLWALYKEVQEYYEKGMRVPDDVTLLWCDDNFGNLRRLPTADERHRSGGAGVYYHFDYVGGPRSYKWINTVSITKVWEQMNLAHQYGADRIWIVNVGDLKPMEFPIEFFMSLAWEPQRWPKERLNEYTRLWAEREFGPTYAVEIADIVNKYTKYNGRRKPELIAPDTFSLVDYQEADRVLAEWKAISDEAEQIYNKLPENARDAFYQLVLYPTKASAVVTELYITAGRNHLYAGQGRSSTNDLAAHARALFQTDADLSTFYNQKMAGGKWNHMMDQTHIGFTSWQDPKTNIMPEVKEIEVPAAAAMSVTAEGSASSWPAAAGASSDEPVLPQFDVFNQQSRYMDVFNRGRTAFTFSVTLSAPWIKVSTLGGTVEKEERLWVSIDWTKVPKGTTEGSIKIAQTGADRTVTVKVLAFNPQSPTRSTLNGFVEADGTVSIEAEHYTRKVDTAAAKWEKIEGYGRTLSAMTIFPPTAPSVTTPQNSPYLEYRMYLFQAGKAEVETTIAPTLDFAPGRALRFAISFDDESPQIIEAPRQTQRGWSDAVRNNAWNLKSTHTLSAPGYHTLKVWMVDPGVVLQKLTVDLGVVKPSYLGPPESYRSSHVSSAPAAASSARAFVFPPAAPAAAPITATAPATSPIASAATQNTATGSVAVTGTEAADTASWAKEFGGGSLSINPTFTEGATSTAVPTGSGMVQTFKGDGKMLEAVGFYFSSTSAPAQGKSFTISLIDYGTEGPINKNTGQMNTVKAAVFSDSFKWNSSGTGRQYYFDFSGASNVVLDSTHYYGFVLQLADASGNNRINRSNNDAYPHGRLGIGTIGAFALNFAGGDRDANFALYTK
jgi:hypothetical protein